MATGDKLVNLNHSRAMYQLLDGKIGDLKSAVNTENNVLRIGETTPIEWLIEKNVGVKSSDGSDVSSSAFSATNFIDVRAFDQITYKRHIVTGTVNTGIAFYRYPNTDTGSYISGVAGIANGSERGVQDNTVAVPLDACYVRCTVFRDQSDGAFSISGRSKLNNVFDSYNEILNTDIIPVTEKNKYVDLSGETVVMSNDVPAITGTSNHYDVCVVACYGGDKFTINGTGGGQTRLWGFVDASGTILTVAGENETRTGYVITAPYSSAFLIVHIKDSDVRNSYKGEYVGRKINNAIEGIYSGIIDVGEMVSGGINRATGGNSGATNCCRTKLLPLDHHVAFVFNNPLYRVFVYGYSTNTGLLVDAAVKPLNDGYQQMDTPLYFEEDGVCHFCKISFQRVDKATMTEADYAAVKSAISMRYIADGDYNDTKAGFRGNVTVRAAKTVMFSDGTPPVHDWYLVQDIYGNFFRSKDLKEKTFLFNFNPPESSLPYWSFGIDNNNNIFAIMNAAGYSSTPELDDTKRINPVYYLASEHYRVQHTLDFGSSFKPAGWLGNVGWCVLPNNDIILCEYSRPTLATCNVWHVSGNDTTDPANWSVTWSHDITSDNIETGFKHCHCVQYDFYTGICYFGTGDSDDGSYIYHSLDNGLTWALTYGPDQNKCRLVTIAFTEDKVYWASDTYAASNHNFFIAERDSNGVIDVENATQVALGAVNKQACYGVVYLKELQLIVMMDRNDAGVSGTWQFQLQAYDIASQTIKTIGYIKPINAHVGFRTLFVDWYPFGNSILVGFDPQNSSIGPATNQNAVCGNLGGTSGDGSTRVNNLTVNVYRKGTSDFSVRFGTICI